MTVLMPIDSLPDELDVLVVSSEREGYGFLTRLHEDWHAGRNRFDGPGECLLGAYVDGEFAGVCGLNVDPYADDVRVGRLRHLYVAPDARGRGVGRALVERLLESARPAFDTVRLRTADEAGGRFYDALGFVATEDRFATHDRRVA